MKQTLKEVVEQVITQDDWQGDSPPNKNNGNPMFPFQLFIDVEPGSDSQ